MSIVTDAKKGIVTEEMKLVASQEGVTEDFVRRSVAGGHIVIPVSPYRKVKICGIGEGLRTKVNASIGTSTDIVNIPEEIHFISGLQRVLAEDIRFDMDMPPFDKSAVIG